MCYFCASVVYDFYIGQQFGQTTNNSIGFSRTSLQKKIFNENFWRSDNRGSDNRGSDNRGSDNRGSDNRGCTVLRFYSRDRFQS